MNSKDMKEMAMVMGITVLDLIAMLEKFEKLSPSQSIKLAMELQNRAVMKLDGIAK